jgi:hypothetical protein
VIGATTRAVRVVLPIAAVLPLAICGLVLTSGFADEVLPAVRTWTFESDKPGAPPAGFTFARTDGRAGRWSVRESPDAPSGKHVLAQTDDDHTKSAPPIAIADDLSFADVRVSVRCKVYSGHVNQVCGIVFRYGDHHDYYVARADVLESHVRLYYVKAGRRTRIGSWRGDVRSGVWNELSAEARGQRLRIRWNGVQVIDVADNAFVDAGRIGVWTESDAVTDFDDLTVAPVS